MTFNTYGDKGNPSLLLIPGLGVSYEIFLPLINLLKDRFHIVAAGIDGFLPGTPSAFTSVDDQAGQIVRYVRENLGGHLDTAYGLSLGGKIISRMMERNEIVIDHAIMDAAPLLPLPKWCVDPLRYYQIFNVWTCYHWTGFWRWVFHSHYFDVLLEECKKVWPSGKGKAVREGYKDVYTQKLETIQGGDIHYWYGTKEAFVAKPQARHLCTLHPDTHVEIFPGMNHGQLLIDYPEEVAKRLEMLFPAKKQQHVS
jgi:pimeloyl-ACP methyl ester carboxylesterase